MIWHIFKKDFKQHWLFAFAVAVLPFAIGAVHLKMDHFFEENEALSTMLLLLELMFYFGVATLTAALVHNDSLVDVRQDWLVRPVRRRDLLGAKVLFLVLVAQLPLFVANIGGGLADGFAFSSTLTAAFTENLYFLLGFTLPVFAFSSLTKNLTEALGAAFALFIAVMGLEMLVAAGNGGNPLGPTAGSGIAWIPQTEQLLICFLAAAAILGLQYFRRSTHASRSVLCGAIALCVLIQDVPWRYAFGFEEAISGAPAQVPSFRFDPGLGKFQSPVSVDPHSSGTQLSSRTLRVTDRGAEIYVPIEVSGVEARSILKVDRASVHLLGANGEEEGAINPSGEQGDFEVPADDATGSSSISHFEAVRIRSNLFNRIKNTPVALQIDYSATLFRLASRVSLPTDGANPRIPSVGWCRTEMNDSRTAIELRCLAAGTLPQCSTALLENPATGARNPAIHGCSDDYAPYLGRYKPPDIILREGAHLAFHDEAGLVHYPVDGSQIGNAQVVLKSYAVAGHFSSRLVIPSIRLADWSAP